jgi:uncharacterized membrane protein
VEGVYRDREGRVRLIETDPSYARMVNRAFDKIRQSSRAMPAVIIRMLDALTTIGEATNSSEQRAVLRRQAAAILRSAEDSVPEVNDRVDIEERYRRFTERMALRDAPPSPLFEPRPT